MELLDSRGGAGPVAGPGRAADPAGLEMLEPVELDASDADRAGGPKPPRPPVRDRLRATLLRRPSRPSRTVVAAVVATACGAAAGAWSVSSAHARDERQARLASVDLRVTGIVPTFDETGLPERADVYLANRGSAAVTVTAGNLGSQDAVQVPLPVPADEGATLTIPLERACGHPLASGDLRLRVRTTDGTVRSVLLRDGRDFLLNGLSDVWASDCGIQTLNQLVFDTAVLVNRRRSDTASQLVLGIGPPVVRDGAQAPVLTGIRSAVAGLEASTGEGWPIHTTSVAASAATVVLRVTSCKALHLPTDPDNDALLQVEGSVVPGAPTETANLYGASLSLALVRVIGRACPDLLRS
ncbi:hypothetical protein CLV35_2744 [Motilibacter peucedani]|uniref:Uncharacterized protein n=1 Tax=Motilibacter peucedani TaxID=598650 RepID=A0A420XMJ5_9ACTN|nr:hypothetical protein [Motilibacter peucedani]RKS72500.1 hypothetical protein CLV35_2744 [Motilibacter peucedani]